MSLCRKCQAPLSSDEIALNKKLIARDLTSFLCLACLAGEFDVSRERLEEKIKEFKRSGCLLFIQDGEQL